MKKIFLLVLTSLLFLVIVTAVNSEQTGPSVIRVIDGDTIVISGNIHIRLLGVDTPELHHPNKKVECFAHEAKKFTESQVLNKKVKIILEGKQDDPWKRPLAWVWYGKYFKKLLNAEIIKEGYGFSFRKYPTSKLEEFNELERQARQQQKGLWHPDACNGQR